MAALRGGIRASPEAYATGPATPDPSCICDLCRGLQQGRILKPLNEARKWTSARRCQVLNPLSHSGTLGGVYLKQLKFHPHFVGRNVTSHYLKFSTQNRTLPTFSFVCVCLFFRPVSEAHGGSQARGLIGAVAAGLHHSLGQCHILNPLSEARDQTCNLIVPSQIHFCCATPGTPPYGNSLFSFWRNFHAVLHSGCASLLFLPTVWEGSLFSILPSIYYLYTFWWCPFWQMWGDTSCNFDFHFSNSHVEYLFMCFFGHLSSLEKCLFRPSDHFLIGFVCFFNIKLHEIFVYFGD